MALSRRSGQRFQASIWPGFVDAMTGLLLVLMFVLTIFMVIQFVLRETITGQADELSRQSDQLDVLSAELAELAAALGMEQQENTALENRLGALNATLVDRDAQLAERQSIINALTATRDQQAAELEAAAARIVEFEDRVAALLADQDAANARISDLIASRDEIDAARAALVDERDALNLALAAARSEIDAGEEAARLAAARREALEALIADLEAKNADAETRIGQLSGQVDDLNTALTDEEAARLAEAEAAAVLRKRLEEADAELTAMTLSLEAQRKDAEDTLTLLAAARAAQEKLNDELAAAVLARSQDSDRVAELEQRLTAALSTQEELSGSEEELRERLAAALAAELQAEAQTEEAISEADRQAALLAAAKAELDTEAARATAAQKEAELLNQQVAALREQLGSLQAILDDAKARDAAAQVQLQSLGSDLNAALARAAAEERRRRELEEEERKRLEAEAADLANYRSEFFGRLRELIGERDGVRIEGDRFVFSSEVLFPPGGAELSPAGQRQIAGIAQILRDIAADIPPEIDWVIRVDGHTDNIPLSGFGQFADNWELSQARALSVVRFMSNFLGIPPDRLSANGFGQYQPINTDDTAEARAQNRRIELKLTEK